MAPDRLVDKQRGEAGVLIEKVHIRVDADVQHALATLNALADTYSPEALFAAAFTGLVVVERGDERPSAGDIAPATLERLAYHLWRHPSAGSALPTPEAVQTATKVGSDLTASTLLREATAQGLSATDIDGLIRDVLINAHVVRGSAYPEQTTDEILEILGLFDAEFRDSLGTSPGELAAILWGVVAALQTKVNRWLETVEAEAREISATSRPQMRRGASKAARRAATRGVRDTFRQAREARVAAEAGVILPISRVECLLADGSVPSERGWNLLLRLIGLTRDVARGIDDPLLARIRPLFVFADDRVLLGDISNALDCLWDALDTQAKRLPSVADRFQATKGQWLEERVVEYLSRVFGSGAVYQNLTYPDPDHVEHGHETELDAAVRWGPFLLLVEAKARQFRLKGQLGDIKALREDLRNNIDDAFRQTLRARRYLESAETAEFRESRTGRVLQVRRADLARAYLITVSLHFLGGGVNRLAKLHALGLMTHGDYPWAVSVSELDLITRFAEGPDVLLHYIERRHEIERNSEFPLNDDLDLFGAYLSTRLNPTDLKSLMPRATMIYLAAFQEPFDRWMAATRTGQSPPLLRLDVPDEIRDVLEELRRGRSDDSARWIAFTILGLTKAELGVVAAALREARKQVPQSGIYRRFANTINDLAFTVVIASDGPLENLEKRTAVRTVIEKYIRRTPRAIGFGVHLGEPVRPFHTMIWIEGPWEFDPRLEALLVDEGPAWVADSQTLPPRNAPCVCGSGRKFKACCLRKLERR